MKKPKLLDLFCGAGGCSVGYSRSGFDVVGVDCKKQPRYPFEFHCGDAFEYLEQHWQEFDAIHASPPCQGYSISKLIHGGSNAPLLIEPVRSALQSTGKPYVIENVPGCPMINPIVLRGNMFGLKVKRDRLFESNCLLIAPELQKMQGRSGQEWGHRRFKSMSRNPSLLKGECDFVCVSGHAFLVEEGRIAMGIDWMTRDELTQAIPPAYTEWIGRQLIHYC